MPSCCWKALCGFRKGSILNDLFTVGRVQPGELVGLIDHYANHPAKRQLHAQPTSEPPLNLIVELLRDDPDLLDSLQSLQSPAKALKFSATL